MTPFLEAPGPGGNGGLPVLLASLLVSFGIGLVGCEDEPVRPDPSLAAVEVDGEVVGPAGAGIEGAEVTVVVHRTEDCSTSVFASDTVASGADGAFAAGPAREPEAGFDFEPRPVCVDVRAEPPADRPGLAASEVTGLTAELRLTIGDEPLDEIEVNLTLPTADAQAPGEHRRPRPR